MATQYDHSWYRPGNWSLPQWWTSGPPMRGGVIASYEDQLYFYNSSFVREVLDHKGGITTLPNIGERS